MKKAFVLSLACFMLANVNVSFAATTPKIKIVGLQAIPNPFSPSAGSLTVQAQIVRTAPSLIVFPIWFAVITDQIITKENWDELSPSHVFFKVSGLGANVSFSWNGKDLKHKVAPDGKYYVYVGAWELGKRWDIKYIEVVLDKTPPRITVTRPANGSHMEDEKVLVEGNVDERLSSMKINGQVIVLNQLSFSHEISLNIGENTLELEAKDLALNRTVSTLTVIREDQDHEPPVLTITQPQDGLLTREESVEVSGSVNETAAVFINHENIGTIQGSFTKTIFLNEGQNNIFVMARDLAGNESSQSLTVTKDATEPQILELSPENQLTTGQPSIEISGKASEFLQSLKIQNEDVMLNSDLRFQKTVTLLPGLNEISIVLTDLAGNTYSQSLSLHYDNVPPEITITSHQDGDWVNNGSVTLSGHVDDASAKFWINNGLVELSPEGAFSKDETLSGGENIFVFKTEDLYGNSSGNELKLYLDTQAPQVSLDPAGGTLPVNMPKFQVDYLDSESGIDLDSLDIHLDGENMTNLFSVQVNHAEYRPAAGLSEGEHNWTVHVQDAAGNPMTAGASFKIQSVEPPEENENQGYIVGTLKDSDTGDAIKNAVIQIDELQGAVVSDEEGFFSFPVPESIYYKVRVAKEGYITAARRIEALKMRTVGLGEILLKKEDLKKTLITQEGGVATDSQNLIEMTFPANAVVTPIQAGATWFMKGEELPGPLPEASQFTYAMELSPDGTTFNTPVTVKFKNTRGFAPGTEIPVGVWNKELIQWTHETISKVTPDGQWIEFQVTHFSTRDSNLPPPPRPATASRTQGESQAQKPPCGDNGNSTVDFLNGGLREKIKLTGYKVLNQENTLSLLYDSEYVSPYFRARIVKDQDTTAVKVPDRVSIGVEFEGQNPIVYADQGLKSFSANFLLKKENARKERLETGLYTWKGRVSYDYLGLNYWYTHQFGGPPTWDTHIPMNDNEYAQYASFLKGAYININEVESPFGAGWQISGVERLYEDPAGSGFLVGGSGDYELFSPQYHVYTALGKNGNAGGIVADIETVTQTTVASYSYEKAKFIAMNPDASKLYIGSNQDRYLKVIDLKTGQNIKTLDLIKDHTSMVMGPIGDKLYVGGRNSANIPVIYVIDTASDSILRQIQTRGFVNFIAISPDETKLYAAETTTSTISYIEIFSLLNYTKDKEIQPGIILGIPAFPTQVAVSPDGRKAYILVRSSQQTWGYIFCLDTQTQNLTNVIANTISPNDIAFLPDSSRAYATYPSPNIFNNPYPGFISIIDTVQDQVIDNITLGLPYYPQQITISPDGKTGYVPSTNKTISVLDLEKNTLIENITVNPTPYKTIITPDSKKLYALCYQTNTYLLGIDTASLALTQTLTLSSGQANIGDIIVSPAATLKHIALDESIITKESDGTYTRAYLDQSKDYFDIDGYKTKSCDTHGNCTEYRYVDSPQTTDRGPQTAGNVDHGLSTVDRLLSSIKDPKGQETTFTYNSQGKLEKIIDPQGRQTLFRIDDDGNLIELTHPDGSNYSFNYDLEHRLTRKTSPRGFATKYNYDENGFIESVEAPTGELREYEPAILDQIITGDLNGETIPSIDYQKGSYSERKDAYGHITKRWLDENGRITKVEDALGRVTQHEYDARGNLTRIIYPNGAFETRTFDVKGNMLTKTLNSIGSVTTYTYDAKWNKPLSIKDANNHTTLFEYNTATGDLVKITDAKGSIWQMSYDAQGLLTSITDPENYVTNYGYDARGNLASKTNALGRTWTYTRNDAGNVIQSTDPLGHATLFEYDSMNRVTKVTDPEGGVTQISYTDSGCTSCGAKTDLITAITDPNDNIYHFEYDEIGQLTKIIDPLGNATEKTYNLNRLLESVKDANGLMTQYRYNEANELIEEEAADGGITQYSYNDLGKLESLTDPNAHTTNFIYDGIGRLISEIDPLGNTAQYQYDKVNNLIEKITANNQTIAYAYDEFDRLVQKITPEQTYTYAYDGLGRLTRAANASSDQTFGYDELGQLVQSTVNSPQTITLNYSYDEAERKISMSDPTGITQYSYDGNDRLVSMTYDNHLPNIASAQLGFTMNYDLGGRRRGLQGPGGMSRAYTYDAANRLTELLNKINGVEIAPFQYTYDKVGNKTQITDKYGNHTANYDEVYRLISLTNSVIPVQTGIQSGIETFAYDLTGNRTNDQSQTYQSNEVNQLTAGSNGLSLSYDANGNVTSKTENGVTSNYIWNSENQLTHSVIPGLDPGIQTTVDYEYDALGRRITKSSNGNEKQYIYDGQNILLECENGVLTSRYTHGPNVDEPLVKRNTTTGENYFYHSDALGSISAITDLAGDVIESYRYTAYGTPQIFDKDGLEISESEIRNPYLHTGREYDFETGLYYHRARYRSSTSGAWLSKDPIGFEGGINIYGYVNSSPIDWVDPWGLYREEVHYYKTYEWARDAGFSVKESLVIAQANQGMDDNWATNPFNPMGTPLHFKKPDIINQELREDVFYGDLESFGRDLHSFQDTFSHKGFKAPLGHLFAGTTPDDYDPCSERDQSMERGTRYYLRRMYKRLHGDKNENFSM